MHPELLHNVLQEEEEAQSRCDGGRSGGSEEEEYYTADFEEDCVQGSYEEDQEEEPEEDAKPPTSSEGEGPRLCQQRVTLEVDGDLMTVHTLVYMTGGLMQWWAAILKNVSFKAIQIHNF